MNALIRIRDEMRRELVERILPFWMQRTPDVEHGGFIGRMTWDGHVVAGAPKGGILNTRILWTFSAAARELAQPALRSIADRAYTTLLRVFKDPQFGGIFWMVHPTGAPLDPKKQVYAQAFAIYAFSEYARLTGNPEALEEGRALFRLLEDRVRDDRNGGYYDAFSRSWGPLDDIRLSEKDLNAPKTMNTHLHLLEAYTNLLRVWPDEALRERLDDLIQIVLDRILDRKTGHLGLYFDEAWRPMANVVSFGHDIEASWLLTEAAELTGDSRLADRVETAALELVEITMAEGVALDGSVLNERYGNGPVDDNRHWWPQVEAIVAWVNAWQLTGDERYGRAAVRCWDYVQARLVDRAHGEWHFRVDREGNPSAAEDKVGPWKAPYHNSRACLEVIRRIR